MLKLEPVLPSCSLLVSISSRKQQSCLTQCLVQPSCWWVDGNILPSLSFPWHEVLWSPPVMWGRGTCWQPGPCTGTLHQGSDWRNQDLLFDVARGMSTLWRRTLWKRARAAGQENSLRGTDVWSCQCSSTWSDPEPSTVHRGAEPTPPTLHLCCAHVGQAKQEQTLLLQLSSCLTCTSRPLYCLLCHSTVTAVSYSCAELPVPLHITAQQFQPTNNSSRSWWWALSPGSRWDSALSF